ncbi:MAG: DUF998 domain-containing protein [Oscillospiraceae bacterium]|nr:DUF998 domain-containing protein [Oscillospiraceae bacterium]
MTASIDNFIFNLLLLITIFGEFLLPWILKHFYKGYNSKTMVMSVLGSPESPVRWIYNAWLVWLGTFLLFASVLFFKNNFAVSSVLAVLIFISISTFAVGAGILSGLFSVNESKEKVTISSKIHGAGSAIGFMTLLFFPLLQCILAFRSHDIIRGTVCMIAFVLAMLFFVFFIMGDKDNFKDTIFSYEGLWERLSLFFMYVPFLYIAIDNLF